MKICKKIWELGTPWIQIAGFVIMCGFITGTYFTKYEAYGSELANHDLKIMAQEARLNALESHYIKIDQNLDDIKNYLLKGGPH